MTWVLPHRPIIAKKPVSEITPNRRKRAVYNDYMRFYNQTLRAIRTGRACPWQKS